MTVLDAYAVIAFLRAEPAADHVRPLLTTRAAALTAVGLAEVLDHLIRLAGADPDDAILDLAQLELLDATQVNAAVGAAAGSLRARHYHRTRCPISLADCIAAETARRRGQPVATADPDLLTVCHREGIPHTPLPDSNGTIWTPPP